MLRFLPILYSSIFLLTSCISIQIKALGSLKCFNPGFSLLLIKNLFFFDMDLLHINIFYQYLDDYLLNLMHLFFQIQNLQLLIFCVDDLVYMVTLNCVLFYFHQYNYQNQSFIFTQHLPFTYFKSICSIWICCNSAKSLQSLIMIKIS